MKLKMMILIVSSVLVLAMSCTKETAVCNTEKVTYNNQIKTIMAGCTYPGCHNSGFVNGGLTSYQECINFPKKDKLLSAVNWDGKAVIMPPSKNKLSDCDISKMAKWIDSGYPEN